MFLTCAEGGILSTDPSENPHYHDANHVFVPYCSSDSWAGDRPARSSSDLSFQGARILEHVVRELLVRGLQDARLLLLAGSSAGAGGVLVNLDRVAAQLRTAGCRANLRGLADSGWFLDNQPYGQPASADLKEVHQRYAATACAEGRVCAPLESIQQGIK